MKKKKKSLIISIATTLVIVSILANVYFSFFYHYKGHEIITNWSNEDTFDVNSISTLNKNKDKDFVILNLTDIQLCDTEDFFHRNKIRKEIDYLVKESNPDLITLTGDQTWSNENLISIKSLIRWLDSYKIPWAPVIGNHDVGNEYDKAVVGVNKLSDLYENSKYCLFKRGPSNLGVGNYIINIKEDNSIVKSLYMLDSGYKYEISNEQIEWVKYNANHIKELNNGIQPEAMCFMHKPLPEYTNAYLDYYKGMNNNINDVYCYCSLGGVSQTGLFNMLKEINTKDIVCGHQHTNNFTLLYEDIRLTFALKTGELSFYYNDGNINLNGGTTFTISNSNTTIKNIYVDSTAFHFKKSDNIYEED